MKRMGLCSIYNMGLEKQLYKRKDTFGLLYHGVLIYKIFIQYDISRIIGILFLKEMVYVLLKNKKEVRSKGNRDGT